MHCHRAWNTTEASWSSVIPQAFFLIEIRLVQSIVIEQLLNEINVGHKHAPTTIPNQSQCIQCISFTVICLEKVQIGIPFVSNYLSTGKTTNGDDHLLPLLSSVLTTKPRPF
uniref:Uncharacterized protein n=1 Tax=Glycine max TaxID=3847 RepID=C6T1S6_SOYBN|nr:unknown [Glycine max]